MVAKRNHTLPPWLRPKTHEAKATVCVAWYTEEDWTKVRATAVDKDRFEATFLDWVKMAENAFAELRAAGTEVEQAFLNADSLLAWCLARGIANDASARAQFVAERSRNAHTDA